MSEQTTAEVTTTATTEAPATTETTTTTAATETKAAESLVTAEAKTETAETKTEKAVPEKYSLTLPEGSKLDATYIGKIETLAKEKGWTNERAQEAVDERSAWFAEQEQARVQEVTHLNDKVWKDELMADKDVGGQKFEENGHLAFKGAEWLFGKEGAESLKAMKLNHHPMLFRGLVKLGKSMEADKIVNINNHTKPGNIPPEQRMYPSMFKKES